MPMLVRSLFFIQQMALEIVQFLCNGTGAFPTSGPRVIKKNRPDCDNNKLRSRKCSNKNKWTKAGARNEAASGSFSTLAFAFIIVTYVPCVKWTEMLRWTTNFSVGNLLSVSYRFSWKTFLHAPRIYDMFIYLSLTISPLSIVAFCDTWIFQATRYKCYVSLCF